MKLAILASVLVEPIPTQQGIQRFRAHFLEDIGHDTANCQGLAFFEDDRRESRVGRSQRDQAVFAAKVLDRELAIDLSHHHIHVLGREGPVDHQEVAVADGRFNHGSAAHVP